MRLFKLHGVRAPLVTGMLLLAAGLGAEPTGSATMELRACMEQLAAHNYELRARYLDAQAQAASAERAGRERWPSLSAMGMVERHSEFQRIQQPSPGAQALSYSRGLGLAGLQFALPLYTGGRLKASQAMEARLADAAAAGAEYFRDRSLLELIEGYHQLQALEYLVQSVDASLEALGAQLRQIDAMVQQQKAADVDRLRVQVRLSTLEQERIRILDTKVQVRESLNFLMGQPAGISWDATAIPDVASFTQPDGPALQEERADEKAARLRREAAAEGLRVARAHWQPELRLVGGWIARSALSDGGRYDDGFVGLSMSWDIWDSGVRRYRVAEALRSTEAARLRESGVRAMRRADWERAVSAQRSARERLEISLLHRTAALETLRIEQRKYEAGHGTITEVLDAEAAALETESLIAVAKADFFASLARRDFAAGRFFQSEADHPALREAVPGGGSGPAITQGL